MMEKTDRTQEVGIINTHCYVNPVFLLPCCLFPPSLPSSFPFFLLSFLPCLKSSSGWERLVVDLLVDSGSKRQKTLPLILRILLAPNVSLLPHQAILSFSVDTDWTSCSLTPFYTYCLELAQAPQLKGWVPQPLPHFGCQLQAPGCHLYF